jgi:hypothetical protein
MVERFSPGTCGGRSLRLRLRLEITAVGARYQVPGAPAAITVRPSGQAPEGIYASPAHRVNARSMPLTERR